MSRTMIRIDFNVRARGNRVRAGFEDAVGPVRLGDTVTVYEPSERMSGLATIVEVDEEARLVFLDVDWDGLRDTMAHTPLVLLYHRLGVRGHEGRTPGSSVHQSGLVRT